MTTIAAPRPSEPQDITGDLARANISRVPYLPGLDGMRAFAVVAVMIYHANSSWLPGGFLGVEVFFVISGYLITLLLIAEQERSYRISLPQFWLRRARRLLPALFLLLILITVWTAIFERDALGKLRGDVIAGIFYGSNWYQVWAGLGYTAAGDFAPLRHLWSLAVEEQFYLVWPLVMVILLRARGTRRIANLARWLVLAALVITVAMALAYHPGVVGEPSEHPEAYWHLFGRPISKLDALYLGTFSRAGGLLLGSAFAMAWRPLAIQRGPLRKVGTALDVGAVVAIVGLGWLCWELHLLAPGGTADAALFRGGFFLTGLLTLLLIAAVTHAGARANRVLGNPVMLWIGTRSYGMYLYHWPIYQIIRGVAGNRLTVREFALAMAVTAVITELSYRFVETPIRTGSWRRLWRPSPHRLGGADRAGAIAAATVLGVMIVYGGVALASADLKQNEIAESLDDAEEHTVDLLDVAAGGGEQVAAPATTPVLVERSVDVVNPAVTEPTEVVAKTTAPAATIAAADAGAVTTTVPAVAETTVPVVPATTVPVAPPAPVQLGVVDDPAELVVMPIPPSASGLPLVALGDSVMLGAAEELQALGFYVDAAKSRQLIDFVPALVQLRDAGVFGSVVVFHLGTNGPFSDATLAGAMDALRDVPVVIVITNKGDRDWIPGNNAKLRALPATMPNVTVLDWEVLSAQCGAGCFYDDGIHLPPTGQRYYTGLIATLLGLA